MRGFKRRAAAVAAGFLLAFAVVPQAVADEYATIYLEPGQTVGNGAGDVLIEPGERVEVVATDVQCTAILLSGTLVFVHVTGAGAGEHVWVYWTSPGYNGSTSVQVAGPSGELYFPFTGRPGVNRIWPIQAVYGPNGAPIYTPSPDQYLAYCPVTIT